MGIMERFQEGGVFMYFILAFGFLTLGVIIERAIALYSKNDETPSDFRNKILDYIARQDYRGARAQALALAPKSGVHRIISAGLTVRENGGGLEELQARMDENLSMEISQLDRRTGFLAMFGNVATLLGLLGTISGMIHSFAAVASASPVDRATMLSKGISEAMNCTAFGLIVAIPALVAYAVFQSRTERLLTSMTEATTQVFHDLAFVTDSDSASIQTTHSNRATHSAPAPQMTV